MRDEGRAREHPRPVEPRGRAQPAEEPEGEPDEEREAEEGEPQETGGGIVRHPGEEAVEEALAAGEHGAAALVQDRLPDAPDPVRERALVQNEDAEGRAEQVPAADERAAPEPQGEDIPR